MTESLLVARGLTLDWGLLGQFFLAVLLAGVGGLVLLFWFEVRRLRLESRTAPLLVEQLASQLLMARDNLQKLHSHLREVAPELGRLLQDANQRQVELKFLLERAHGSAEKLEHLSASAQAMVRPMGPVAAVPNPVIGPEVGLSARRVAEANGAAAISAGRDPIEELLARMAHADADQELRSEAAPLAVASRKPLVESKPKRARGVTQAELDLQAKALGR